MDRYRLTGAKPTDLNVAFSEKNKAFDNFNFTLPDGALLAGIWLPDPSVDKHPGVMTDVVVNAVKCRKVLGIDTLSGFRQELRFEQRADRVVVPKVMVRDYPLMLRIEKEK